MSVTTLGGRQPGDRLNIEFDYLAKVVARLGASALDTATGAGGQR
jgi:riboflavin synthase alpha subunit